MSRTTRMGLIGVAIVVLTAAGSLAAEPPKLDAGAQERAARAEQMLAQTRADLTRLERDVTRAREVSPEPPRRMLAQLDLARGRAHAAEVAARGLHWRVARPILAEVKRAIGEADRLETLLRTPLPRPPMPVGLAPAGTGSISGTVTDAATGLPLAGVQVKLKTTTYPYSEFDATTDASGDYVFTALGMGVYRLWTHAAEGYLDEAYSGFPCTDGQCLGSWLRDGNDIGLDEGQFVAGLDFALQPAASISGAVSALAGNPLSGAEVYVHDSVTGAYDRSSSTDSNGVFNSGDMFPGTYFLLVDHPEYLDQLYEGLSCEPTCIPEAGTPIVLAPSLVLTGLNIVLTPGGRITGTVTDSNTGEPVVDYMIDLYDHDRDFVGYWYVSGPGFEIGDLAPGTYFLRLSTYSALFGGYVNEVFDNVHCTPECDIGAGTPIIVAAGATTAGIDFALETWGRIGGVVTAAESGFPLSGNIEVFDSSGLYMLLTSSSESGDWLAGGLRNGTYFAIAAAEDRLGELWNDLPCEPVCDPMSGAPIPAALGVVTDGVDFALGLGGWITGTVTRRTEGTPIQNVEVRVFDQNGAEVTSGTTGPLGHFFATGLPAGIYTAMASLDGYYYPDDFECQLFDDLPCEGVEGTPITVAAGAETGGVDFALRRLGSISGRVTSVATGQDLYGYVKVYDSAGQVVRSTSLSGGRYWFSSLEPGTYFVKTTVYDGFQNELWDDIPCDSSACDVTTGTPVAVGIEQEVTEIDFALILRGSLSGSVTESGSGQAIPYASVSLYNSEGSFVTSSSSDEVGGFVVSNVPAGTYFVKAGSHRHSDEVYDNIPCESSCDVTSGTPVFVQAGQESGRVDFVLDRRGSISGTVTDETTGAGMYANLQLYDASGAYVGYVSASSGNGQYRFEGLASGVYYVMASSYDHTTELYDDIPCLSWCDVTTGTPITVVDGQDTPGIDIALALQEGDGYIKGRVTGPDGQGLASVAVRFYSSAGVLLTGSYTQSLGYYESSSLPAGSYFVDTMSQMHRDELYDNLPCEGGCDVTAGTAVTVSSGAVTENVDFVLEPMGRIQGRVIDQVSGRPIPSAYVLAFGSSGEYVTYALTLVDGSYALWGLTSGTYYVRAERPGYISEVFDDIPCEEPCDETIGQPVSVTIGQATTGIDFALMSRGGIAGRVTDRATGVGVQSATAHLHAATGDVVVSLWATNGYFYFSSQPAGTYYVTASANGYIGQLYAGQECEPSCDVTVGAPVVVRNGVITNDINFSLRKPYFADVPVEYWSRRYIESLYAAGVTAGCSVDPPLYCPAVTVSRAQAAPLLLRSDEGSGYVPPPAVGVFEDVPVESGFAPWIEELALREITAGCSVDPPLYCPEAAVTRAQMAVFLLKTLEGEGYEPPPAVGMFEDVPVEDPFASWIEEIARRGITAGCSAVPPLYCPGAVVARDQVAVFLVKAFNLPPAL